VKVGRQQAYTILLSREIKGKTQLDIANIAISEETQAHTFLYSQ